MNAARYAGWILVDARLATATLVFSVAIAVVVVAVFFRGRRWDEHIVGFFAVFLLTLCAMLILTNAIASFPAVQVETFFRAQ